MSMPSSGAAAPPPYPQSSAQAATSTSHRNQSSVISPVPFFDSILRAAPAFDYENEDEIGHDNDSASSSTVSLTQQLAQNTVSDWSSKVGPNLEQHASLHAFLDANANLNERLTHVKERIHTTAGKRTSLATRVTRLQKKLHELQLESDQRRKLLFRPKKRREFVRQVHEVTSELEPLKEHLQAYEVEIALDEESVANLTIELAEQAKVSSQLDAIDDDIFGGPTQGHEEEDMLEQQYHILMETIRRLQSTIATEARCQVHLNKAHSLCLALIKELLIGLNIGIEIGVPTNQKHKTQLWRGNSPTHSANRSRGHVLRAKTISGDLHMHYLLARAAQRRVAVLPKMRVIDLVRLPGMTARNATDEQVRF
jgi:predicted  nucleic acid-binding Zn-ribbon protein